jgi:hypothetical protein
MRPIFHLYIAVNSQCEKIEQQEYEENGNEMQTETNTFLVK